ncbi:MAG: alpha/beta hydrolase [Chloroflexota bacterium]
MTFDFDDAFNDRPLCAESSEAFITDDGERIAVTGQVRGHSAAILVVPGMLMTRGCSEHRLFASQLQTVADIYTMDVRGHGESSGRFSFGVHEPRDVAGIAAILQSRYQTVGGIGFSLGGYHVLMAAASANVFAAVAAVGTPTRLFPFDGRAFTRNFLRAIPMAVRRRRGWLRIAFPSLTRRRPSLLKALGEIDYPPVLIAHGERDWLVPSSHAQRIYAQTRMPKELLVVTGAGHAESLITEPSGAFPKAAAQFFRRYLTGVRLTAAS